ncbi:DUF4181 domain-containing protein [Rossellomorea sp. NPDC077527]|uniref:DUF4181 domain-containing protein n=1 Tax=Rossellomorea sp. NPDC077527 TaxID=3364510 RepID=UPI0037C61289
MNIIFNDIFQFILYFTAFLLVFFVIEKKARRKWSIEKPDRSSAQGINSVHVWGKRLLWTVFFICVIFYPSGVINVALIVVIWAFETYMQWKHENSKREYIITFMGLIAFIIFISIGYSFDLLL